MFTINPDAIPAISTRKALVVIDLQNDFVGPDGVLPVTEPEEFVSRTLELVRAFRSSGAGPVIWVRSEFERHRPLTAEGDQIVTSDHLQRPGRPGGSRGRQPTSKVHDGAVMEIDDEAFLSVSEGDKKPICVRKGTQGSKFPARVQEAIERQDFIFTKTHYSAFASSQQQLVQLLRGKFVTEMYVCGSLTNIGVYATALDAGRHGYEMTIVEDCCGFRNEMRHVNAVRQLMELIGSEVVNAEVLIEKLQPPKPKKKEVPKPSPKTPTRSQPNKTEPPGAASGLGPGRESGENASEKGAGIVTVNQKSPVRPQPVARQEPQVPSTGLSPSMSKVSLSRGHESPAAPPSSQPAGKHVATANKVEGQKQSESAGATREVQTLVTKDPPATAGDATNRQGPLKPAFGIDDTTPLEVDSDPGSELSSPETADVEHESRYRGAAAAEMRSRRGEAALKESPRSQVTAQRAPSGPAVDTSQPKQEKMRVVPRPRTRQRPGGPAADNSPSSTPSPKRKDTSAAQSSTSPSRNSDSRTVAASSSPQAVPSLSKTPSMAESQDPAPIFSAPICEGDTTIISNALSSGLAADAFERLLKEVSWASMSRMGGEVPRRIAVQGTVDDEGNMPVYRHPADESPPLLPFSPTVLAIKTEIEKHLGHPLNHVLIQHYRNGSDYISEHSDKSLDIVRGSYIANVSLGAERTMVFRTKRPPKDPAKSKNKPESDEDDKSPSADPTRQKLHARQTERAPLPHNSLCRMGLQTNMRWLHAIRQDKRSDREKSAAELAHDGARISLTFRQIGTFLDSSQTRIWGQGAVSKTKASAQPVVNGQTPEAVQLLQAFGAENNSSEFDWEAKYGAGFNVLHMGTPKRFCAGSDEVANTRVRLALAELGISCAKGSVEADVRFEDNDPGKAVLDGHDNVLRYLDAVYGAGRRYDQLPAADVAKRFTRLQKGLDLLGIWRRALEEVGGVSVLGSSEDEESTEDEDAKEKRAEVVRKLGKVKELKTALTEWEGFARESATATLGTKTKTLGSSDVAPGSTDTPAVIYIAGGDQASPADFAVWPVLHEMVRVCGFGIFAGLGIQSKKVGVENENGGYLAEYYGGFGRRSAVVKALGI